MTGSMEFSETPIAGALLIGVEPRSDERGFFARVWCEGEFDARALHARFVQANIAFSQRRGTMRGLHYQLPPHAEAKLVRCIQGRIFDVIVDVRPESSSYGRWYGTELSAENRRAVYVPDGCAHGYQTLTDGAEVFYLVSAQYEPDAEAGIRHDDPAFGIEWPLEVSVISEKDRDWSDYQLERASSSDQIAATPSGSGE